MAGISTILNNSTGGSTEYYNGVTTPNINSETNEEESTSTKSGDTSSINEDQVELSSRAQHLQKLKEEFFPAGYKSIQITPTFIERLHDYGFLSAAEAEKLSPSVSSSSSNSNTDTVQISELSQSMDKLSDRLKTEAPNNDLITILQKADTILDNLDAPLSTTQYTNTKSVIAELAEYTNREESPLLSDTEKATLHNLEITLRIAEKLNQSDNVSSQINSYLSILAR